MVTPEAKKTNATTQTNHIGMSLRFLESASYWTGVFAVGLTAAAAVAGLLTWYFSSKLANVREAAFNRFKEESKVAVASANEKAAEATARAAEANRIAEEEKLARVKLEARLAPRLLPGESQQAVVNAIKQFAPQSFDIVLYADDPESTHLADDIDAICHRAGWVEESSNSWLFTLVTGVVVEFAPSKADTVGIAGNALALALRKEGIDATAQPRDDDDKEKQPERLRIKVGKKL
jgi:hypothetical protein